MREHLRERFKWVTIIAGLATVWLLASAATTHIGVSLLIDEESIADGLNTPLLALSEPPESIETGEGSIERAQRGAGLDYLAKHNYFCPACRREAPGGGSLANRADNDVPAPGILPAPPGIVRSSLRYHLAATMEATQAADSIAVFVHIDHHTSRAFNPGEEVEINVKLERVERGRVIVRNGTRQEYIDTATPPAPALADAAVSTQQPVVDGPAAPKSTIEDADRSIRCQGNTCIVDKVFRDKLIANPALLSKEARAVPAMKDGEVRGFKFYGIRPGSVPSLFGMRNGDVISAVNGQEFKTADEVLGLYAKLRRAPRLTVTLERKGEMIDTEIVFE